MLTDSALPALPNGAQVLYLPGICGNGTPFAVLDYAEQYASHVAEFPADKTEIVPDTIYGNPDRLLKRSYVRVVSEEGAIWYVETSRQAVSDSMIQGGSAA